MFNILNLYSNEIDLFYDAIDKYFRERISIFIDGSSLEKRDLKEELEIIISFLTNELVNLGFEREDIENKFSDQFLKIRKSEIDTLNTPIERYNKKLAPIVYEIFLEKIIDYLVDPSSCVPLLLELKSRNFLPIEFMMELTNLKNLFEKYPDKIENLKKYIQIREKIIHKFSENKEKIEKLEDLENPQDKLQLIYLIYRIIDFFHASIKNDKDGYFLEQIRGEFKEKVYFPYEDTALFVFEIITNDNIILNLNTGKEVKLDPTQLLIKSDHLYMLYKDETIKFTEKSMIAISHFIEDTDEGFYIRIKDKKYKIIFMRREMEEILRSQQKMLGISNEQDEDLDIVVKVFERDLIKAKEWANTKPNVDIILINFKDIINNPLEEIQKINSFLELELASHKMVEVVDPDLYRSKPFLE